MEIDLRAKDGAAPGRYVLDLEWASLNAGRLVLTPEPVPGLDGTDGSVVIEAPPAPPQTSASLFTPLIPLAIQHASAVQPTARTEPSPAPVIDWSARVSPTSPMRPTAKLDEGWARDFVVNLGQSDDDRKPNDKLRLPATAKVSPRVRS